LLSAQVPEKPDSSSPHLVKVEFDGGYFTKAADLRRLSDEEIRYLRVVTLETQVVLGDWEAVVIGTADAGRKVYQEWARARPARYPRHKGLGYRGIRSLTMIIIQIISVLLILGPIVWSFTELRLTNTFNEGMKQFGGEPVSPRIGAPVFIIFAVGLLTAIGAEWLFKYTPRSTGPGDFARILPISWDEYRRNRTANVLPRWTLIVGALSVTVAIATIIVSVLIAK
jgi:hypothetical protein